MGMLANTWAQKVKPSNVGAELDGAGRSNSLRSRDPSFGRTDPARRPRSWV